VPVPIIDRELNVPTTLKDVYATMDTFLYPHKALYTMMDVALATTVVRRFGLENVWIFLVGPSGCGKSEILMSFKDSNKTVFSDDFTGASLISGYKDEEWEKKNQGEKPRLMLSERLKNKTLVIKDLTLLLGNPKEAKKVFDQFRLLYDGYFNKEFGNYIKIDLQDNFFNLLGGCTDAIDRVTSGTDYLGSRFLYYRVPDLPGEALMQIATMASGSSRIDKKEKQLALTRQVRSFLSYAKIVRPKLPNTVVTAITRLAMMLSGLRAHSTKDGSGRLIVMPVDEYPTRVAQQLSSFCIGLAAIKNKASVDADDVAVAKQLVLGSLPKVKVMVLREFWRGLYPKQSGPVSLNAIIRKLRMPEATVSHLAQELYINRLIDKAATPTAQGWVGTERLWELVSNAGVQEDLLNG